MQLVQPHDHGMQAERMVVLHFRKASLNSIFGLGGLADGLCN
jgi:hypothetical protein